MKFPILSRRVAAAPLAFVLALAVVLAQQPKTPTPSAAPSTAQGEPTASSATIDTLFAADSYAIYGEMRMVGQFFSSGEFKALLEPVRLSSPSTPESNEGTSVALPGAGLMMGIGPAPELNSLIEFFNSHAEMLSSSRVAFGAMPVADGLPDVVAAVELSSAEDAAKLEPQLRQFINAYYTKHPEAAGASPDGSGTTRTATLGSSPPPRAAATHRAQTQTSPPTTTVRAGERVAPEVTAPFFIKRAGSLVVMADKPFTFRRLRGTAGAQMLSDEPGFQAARARLSSDTLFLYFNTARMSSSAKRQREEFERQRKQMEAEAEAARKSGQSYSRKVGSRGDSESITVRSTNTNGVTVTTTETEASGGVNNATRLRGGTTQANTNRKPDDISPDPDDDDAPRDPFAGMSPEERAQAEAWMAKEKEEEEKRKSSPGYEEEQKQQERQREFQNQLGRVVFGGDQAQGAWAESIGVGASLQGDQVVVRSLFYSDSDASPLRPVPFIPILLSGPQVAPEAASVVPADADIYVSASLDLPQMYDYVASVFKLFDMASAAAGETDKQGLFASQVSAFEKENKFRIKEDLLATLGNEIAVVVPGDFFGIRRPHKTPKPESTNASSGAQGQTDAEAPGAAPVIIISLTDKKALEELLPRVLEAVGLKGATEQQLIEKHGDVDVLAFTNGAVAIIDRFLVVSPDAATARWVADAYNRRETLAGSEEFRRAAGWQEHQLLGQVYVSNALLKEMFADVHKSAEDVDDPALRAYLLRLDPNPGAITHSLTRDGSSLFHELHVPKNLLALLSASAIVAAKTAEQRRNEQSARFAAQMIASQEGIFKEANGRYATLDELKAKPTLMVERGGGGEGLHIYQVTGYELKLTASGDKFEATLTPTNYPKLGRRSFYIDQTSMLRGGDLGGRAATAESETIY